MDIIGRVEETWRKEWSRPKSTHWPSELTDCRRKLWMKWMGTPASDPITETGLWKMEIGNAIHAVVQNALSGAMPGRVWTETSTGAVPVPGLRFAMSGRLDMIVEEDDGTLSGVEIKSTYGRGARITKEEGPKDSALWQAIAYMELDRLASEWGEPFTPGGRPIARVHIVYLSRDDGDRAQYVVTPNEDRGYVVSRHFASGDTQPILWVTPGEWRAALKRLEDVEVAVDADLMPPRDFQLAIKNGEIRDTGFVKAGVKYKGDWQCSYCQYRQACWRDEVERLADGDNSLELGVNDGKQD